MHDVDRTLLEFESEYGEMGGQEMAGEGEEFLGELFETESHEQEQGFLGEANEGFLGETYGTQELHEAHEQGFLGEVGHEAVFDEVTEMELAAELLELNNEEELEQFLGKLIRGATRAVGNIARGPIGQALLPILKKAAKVALPVAGAALGNLVVPGLGGAIGGKLASAAGSMFGLEFEGMSPQDREFEVARRYVRFAGTTARQLARTPTAVPVNRAVRIAAATAARRHIPGLVRPRTVAAVNSVLRQARQGARPWGRGRPGMGGRRGGWGRPGYYGAVPYGDGGVYSAGPTYGDGGAAPYGDEGDTPSYLTGNGRADDGSGGGGGPTRAGRWYRRGRRIVLVGL
jgi:hypothetical protein